MPQPTTAYPLCWPQGRPRTEPHRRTWSNFKTGFGRARDECLREIDLLGGKEPIISTNLALRLDGLPRGDQAQPRDSGVAVYFVYKKRPMCFACDRWAKVDDNMHAIALTIGALRGIARWGTGDMMEAAFTGFAALPASVSRPWREVLHVGERATREETERNYRALRSANHPDKGGDGQRFDEVQKAWEQAQKELLA